MNRKTAVRKRGQQQAAARKEENPNAVITSPHFTQYWFLLDNGTTRHPPVLALICWTEPESVRLLHPTGLLVVGKGEPGTLEIIVRHTPHTQRRTTRCARMTHTHAAVMHTLAHILWLLLFIIYYFQQRWKDDHHDFQDLRYVGFSSWDKPIQVRST
jgi:hypothetical protein